MRNRLTSLLIFLFATGVFSSVSRAQVTHDPAQPPPSKPAGTPVAPAPRRDIYGVWSGPVQAKLNDTPPLTPYGEKQFAANQRLGGITEQATVADTVPAAESNDPAQKCDPAGFPRNVLWQMRGAQFIKAPTKVVELFQYQRVWREIWTDGRQLPKNAGTDAVDAPDPRYYGYSIGHWDGDYTFVVDSNDTDEATWLDHVGHPHSNALHVTERYTRVDHDTLSLTVNIDDPKIFTKPYAAATTVFQWNPKQEFEEQLCIPSDAQTYLEIIARPAAAKPKSK